MFAKTRDELFEKDGYDFLKRGRRSNLRGRSGGERQILEDYNHGFFDDLKMDILVLLYYTSLSTVEEICQIVDCTEDEAIGALESLFEHEYVNYITFAQTNEDIPKIGTDCLRLYELSDKSLLPLSTKVDAFDIGEAINVTLRCSKQPSYVKEHILVFQLLNCALIECEGRIMQIRPMIGLPCDQMNFAYFAEMFLRDPDERDILHNVFVTGLMPLSDPSKIDHFHSAVRRIMEVARTIEGTFLVLCSNDEMRDIIFDVIGDDPIRSRILVGERNGDAFIYYAYSNHAQRYFPSAIKYLP